jgi:hypothetical protein
MLRFGVILNDQYIHDWEYQCIKNIEDNQVGKFLVIIFKNQPYAHTFKEKIKRMKKLFKCTNILFFLFSFFIVRPKSQRIKDISEIYPSIEKMYCDISKKEEFSQYFYDDDIEMIKKHNLDFILRFGFGIIRGEILNSARYGVWSFHHDDEMKYRGRPPCFWEIYDGDPITASVLQRLTEKLDAGVILRKGYFRTIGRSYSKNIDQAFFESLYWPSEVCKEILNSNNALFEQLPSQTMAGIFKEPTNTQMITFFIKLAKNMGVATFNLFKYDKWNIGVIEMPIFQFIQNKNKVDVQWMDCDLNKGNFFADPTGIRLNNTDYIFFEYYNFEKRKGTICRTQISKTSDQTSPLPCDYQEVFADRFHLAYPYLFKYNEEIFLVHENDGINQIYLYKAIDFPFKWKKIKTLVDNFPGIDNTLTFFNGYWWMFNTHRDFPQTKLYIWYSDDLLGDWKPHKLNPVKDDIRSSRPGGSPFIINNVLYRPAQNSSKTYGGELSINEVIELTPESFKEKPVFSYHGFPPYDRAFHTLSSFENVIFVDGKKFEYGIKFFIHNLKEIYLK